MILFNNNVTPATVRTFINNTYVKDFSNTTFKEFADVKYNFEVEVDWKFWKNILEVSLPAYSYLGASIATDITRLFVITAEFIFLSKIGFNLQNRKSLNNLIKIVIACLIMSAIIIVMQNTNIFLIILVSVIIYFMTLLKLSIFDDDDFQIFIYVKNKWVMQ